MKLVWLGLAVALSLTVTSAVSAQPGEFVKGVLQPLADGFPKRPVTLLNVDEPGSRDGIYARILQQALTPLSPVPIIVSDEREPTFGTYVKLKSLQTREGGVEGYFPQIVTVWGSTIDLLIEPITEEVGVGLDDLNMVIVTETMPYVMVQRKNAPWGRTWADLVKYGKANPGKLSYISNQVGSGNDVACEWIMQQVGLKPTKIPQKNTAACMSVIGAGEGDFTLAMPNYVQSHWEGGKIDILMVMGSSVPSPWDKDPNIISSVAAGLPKVPMGIIAGFAVPKEVPQSHADWLFKLFKAGASTDVYKQREKTIPALHIEVMDGATANKLKWDLYKFADPVVRAIGLHVDDQKKKK